jgi:hypothetical protein
MNELKKEFLVPNTSAIRSAIVYMCGLGYYELYLNDYNVDPSRQLDPGWTNFEIRTLLVSFDVTENITVSIAIENHFFFFIMVDFSVGWYECNGSKTG